ncbi:O-antigen ligase family protein [Chitinispirillales bacterium ANBcel5]|uniref:hypothetical protein n=1 Tax=Cellulosispirillum alkaliphilum TaxID=3039283 RepID=UPI002A511A2C|nr:O-antigen ligase family protein [Chitinispirillales bacterium ANBcel5]
MGSLFLYPQQETKPKQFSALLYIVIICLGHFLAYRLALVPVQLEAVVIFSAILFYPILKFPRCGIYLLFCSLPLIPHFRRLYYLIYDRPALDPLIVFGDILSMYVFAALFFSLYKRQKSYREIQRYCIIIFLYFLYVIARAFIFNSSGFDGIVNLRFYAPQVLLFFAGIAFGENFKMHKNLWAVTVIVGIIACLYGLKQLYFGYSEAEKIWFSQISFRSLFIAGHARPFSFFQSPAAFADYLQLSLLGVLFLTFHSSFSRKLFSLVLLCFFSYGIIITSVRSNWAGLGISLFVWFVLLPAKSTHKRILLVSVIIFSVILLQFLESKIQNHQTVYNQPVFITDDTEDELIQLLVFDRVSAITDPFSENSVQHRLSLWKELFAISATPYYAILGRGTGSLNADSLYITYLAEFGYPGMIFITLLVLLFIKTGLNLFDNSDNNKTKLLAKVITTFNITFALINLTGTHIHSFPGDTYFWFWNGVLIKLAIVCKYRRSNIETSVNS